MTKYIRLLTYEQAIEVIKFINKDEQNYASITPGGIQVQSDDFGPIEDYITDKGYRHEWGEEPPHLVTKKIVDDLKEKGTIK